MRSEIRKIAAFLLTGTIIVSASGCNGKKKNVYSAQTETTDVQDSSREENHISLLSVMYAPIETQVYTSEPIVIHPALSLNKVDLVEGTDYVVSITDNTLPGEAEVTISGIGIFTGVVKLSFPIILNDDYCDDTLNANILYFVKDFYEAFLDRLPSREEWVTYTRALGTKSTSLSTLFTDVLLSKEYQTRQIDDLETLEKAYNLICDRGMTDEERAEAEKRLQSKGENACSILCSDLSSEFMIDTCLAKGMYSVNLEFSDMDLSHVFDDIADTKWIGKLYYDDFDGDGFNDAVRQSGVEMSDGYYTTFWHTDGYRTYKFSEEKAVGYIDTRCWTILNDNGRSFLYISKWATDVPDQFRYTARIYGLERSTYVLQYEGTFADVSASDVNTVSVIYYDSEAPTEAKTMTLTYSEGVYK